MNWPGRRREEEGSELIAHIRVIQFLPVANNWIDEDGESDVYGIIIGQREKKRNSIDPNVRGVKVLMLQYLI